MNWWRFVADVLLLLWVAFCTCIEYSFLLYPNLSFFLSQALRLLWYSAGQSSSLVWAGPRDRLFETCAGRASSFSFFWYFVLRNSRGFFFPPLNVFSQFLVSELDVHVGQQSILWRGISVSTTLVSCDRVWTEFFVPIIPGQMPCSVCKFYSAPKARRVATSPKVFSG